MPLPNLTLLDLSDEDLDKLSEITEQDIILVQQFFVKSVDPVFKNLLLAEVIIEDEG